MRGNEPGSIVVNFMTPAESLAAFDRLPKRVREALANARRDLDPAELAKVAKQRGWSVEEMIAAVKWVDERAVNGRAA